MSSKKHFNFICIFILFSFLLSSCKTLNQDSIEGKYILSSYVEALPELENGKKQKVVDLPEERLLLNKNSYFHFYKSRNLAYSCDIASGVSKGSYKFVNYSPESGGNYYSGDINFIMTGGYFGKKTIMGKGKFREGVLEVSYSGITEFYISEKQLNLMETPSEYSD